MNKSCPHCNQPISLISKALAGPAKPNGKRECPHCGGAFKITPKRKVLIVASLLFANQD